jgi:hypothetical protein
MPYDQGVRNMAVALMHSGMTPSEIQAKVGIPRSTAASWLHKHLDDRGRRKGSAGTEKAGAHAPSVRKRGKRLIVEIDLD